MQLPGVVAKPLTWTQCKFQCVPCGKSGLKRFTYYECIQVLLQVTARGWICCTYPAFALKIIAGQQPCTLISAGNEIFDEPLTWADGLLRHCSLGRPPSLRRTTELFPFFNYTSFGLTYRQEAVQISFLNVAFQRRYCRGLLHVYRGSARNFRQTAFLGRGSFTLCPSWNVHS